MDTCRIRQRNDPRGGRNGEHLYPSFPYGSYARMTAKDVNDLWGFMKTLPKSAEVAPPHDLPFPYNMRMALGGWKLLFLTDKPRVSVDGSDPKLTRGQYLVEGRAIVANVIRPEMRLAVSSPSSGSQVRRTRKVRAASPTSRPAPRASVAGAPRTSPPIWKPVSPRNSIPSAARWSRCRRTWRS